MNAVTEDLNNMWLRIFSVAKSACRLDRFVVMSLMHLVMYVVVEMHVTM